MIDTCWKCEKGIYSQSTRFYLKIRDGNYVFCEDCYKDFLQKSHDFIRPERSKRDELERSYNMALSNFHDEMVKEKTPIPRGHFMNLPTRLVHYGNFWRDCEVCQEIRSLSMRCSEHCGNTVRDK